jgi:DNA-binding IclR family transcriptional regulator
VGKVLLAYAGPAYLEEVIARGLTRLTPHTITDPEELRRDLAEARRTGYAVTREEMTPRTVSVAAPIRGPVDEVVGAISLVVDSHGADVRGLAPPVRTAALGISRRVAERWDLPPHNPAPPHAMARARWPRRDSAASRAAGANGAPAEEPVDRS